MPSINKLTFSLTMILSCVDVRKTATGDVAHPSCHHSVGFDLSRDFLRLNQSLNLSSSDIDAFSAIHLASSRPRHGRTTMNCWSYCSSFDVSLQQQQQLGLALATSF